MRILFCITIILFFSCKQENWKSIWIRDKTALNKAVDLLKSNKLKIVYGRSGYSIPDSLNLQEPYGNLAFRQSDFTYDSTYSILFFLEHSDTRTAVRPAFVYTNNQKRMDKYENGYSMVKKLENNWYYAYE